MKSLLLLTLLFIGSTSLSQQPVFTPFGDGDPKLNRFRAELKLAASFKDTEAFEALLADSIHAVFGYDAFTGSKSDFLKITQYIPSGKCTMAEYLWFHSRFDYGTLEQSHDPMFVSSEHQPEILYQNYPLNPDLQGNNRNFMDGCPIVFPEAGVEIHEAASAHSPVVGIASEGCACSAEKYCLDIPYWEEGPKGNWWVFIYQNEVSGWVESNACLTYADYYTKIFLVEEKGRLVIKYVYSHPGC